MNDDIIESPQSAHDRQYLALEQAIALLPLPAQALVAAWRETLEAAGRASMRGRVPTMRSFVDDLGDAFDEQGRLQALR